MIPMHDKAYSLSRSVPLEPGVDWEEKMKAIARQITGFSGREISKLAIAWQVSSYTVKNGV